MDGDPADRSTSSTRLVTALTAASPLHTPPCRGWTAAPTPDPDDDDEDVVVVDPGAAAEAAAPPELLPAAAAAGVPAPAAAPPVDPEGNGDDDDDEGNVPEGCCWDSASLVQIWASLSGSVSHGCLSLTTSA